MLSKLSFVLFFSPFAEQLFALQDVQFKPKKFGLDKIMAAVTSHHAMAVDTVYVDDVRGLFMVFVVDLKVVDICRDAPHDFSEFKCTL